MANDLSRGTLPEEFKTCGVCGTTSKHTHEATSMSGVVTICDDSDWCLRRMRRVRYSKPEVIENPEVWPDGRCRDETCMKWFAHEGECIKALGPST